MESVASTIDQSGEGYQQGANPKLEVMRRGSRMRVVTAEVMGPWQGPEDEIWEAQRGRVGTVVGGNCWNRLREAGPKRMLYDPEMGDHVYPK